MVKRVPSNPTVRRPAARMASAVGSAMCSSGMPTAASMASATLCIVFVQTTTKSAPAASSERAAPASSSPAASQSPACCSRSTSAKSRLTSTTLAECSPPRRAFTTSLTVR